MSVRNASFIHLEMIMKTKLTFAKLLAQARLLKTRGYDKKERFVRLVWFLKGARYWDADKGVR